MRTLSVLLLVLGLVSIALGQSDNAVVMGTFTDA